MNTFVGRMAADPELRYSDAGNAWMGQSFAIEVRMKKDGEWVSETIWCDLKIFGKIAEHVASHVSKGTRLIVQGNLQPSSYTNKDGQTVERLVLIAENVGLDLRFGLDYQE